MEERKKRALISVSDKTGIELFARGLDQLGWVIDSSGGTATYLKEHGLPVTDLANVTGVPPILGHRVVSLHPKVHGAILADRTPEHDAERARYDIGLYDLVCVDLYHVKKAIATPDATLKSVIEKIDIGGVALIRAAAKNHQHVIVICDPDDRMLVLADLYEYGDLTDEQRLCLAIKVFATTADYDTAIWKYLAQTGGETDLQRQ